MGNIFGFAIHPFHHKSHVGRWFPLLGRVLSERQIDFFSTFFPPVYLSEITGVRSEATGEEIMGHLVACPLTPRQMLGLPLGFVYRKIIRTGRMAARHGARLFGLGAYTSIVGDAGISVAAGLDIPVTTGDSYTVAVVVRTMEQAANLMGIDLRRAAAAVVGATGAIGAACAEWLAEEVGELILIGRRPEALEAIRERCEGRGAALHTATDLAEMRRAALILTATSAVEPIVKADYLKPGAVICDVSQPRDVSREVAAQRPDVLVIEGGMVDVPGAVDYHFNIDLPPGKAYACLAETMALVLEGRCESFTLGKHIELARAKEIDAIAARHGFRVAGFRSFGQVVTDEVITRVRQHAEEARRARD
jgi:fatty aldehyde-generating acyl-ACP reductase